MPDDAGPSLDDGIRAARARLAEPAPLRGLIDLPVFDETVGDRSIEARRRTVHERVGQPIPLTPGDAEVDRAARRKTRIRIAMGVSAALFVLMIVVPVDALTGALGFGWLVSLVVLWSAWRSGRRPDDRPLRGVPDHDVHEQELRVVWAARREVATIMRSRAWNSDDVRGSVALVDLGETLSRLTARSIDLYRFVATASPEPTGARPEVVEQWRRERDRVMRAREQSVEQLAALIVYREEMDRVSSLLDQRDQMAVLAERATEFDQIDTHHSSPSLESAGRRTDLEHNLTAQIRFLGQMADRSATAGPLSDAIHRN